MKAVNKILMVMGLGLMSQSVLAQSTMREAFKDKFLSMQSLDNYNDRQMAYADECERISIMHDMGDYSEDYPDAWCSPYDFC